MQNERKENKRLTGKKKGPSASKKYPIYKLQLKVPYRLSKSGLNKSPPMKGDIAASNALGHSSCGRCPHPDIATSLCTAKNHGKDQIKSLLFFLSFFFSPYSNVVVCICGIRAFSKNSLGLIRLAGPQNPDKRRGLCA